jgi:hypothetical protein
MKIVKDLTRVVRYTVKLLKVVDLRIAPEDELKYNREIKLPHLKEIRDTFDINKVGVLKISLREDGFYYIIDGQHRKIVLEELGIEYIECQVYTELTIPEEAEMFFTCAENTLRINSGQKFKANLVMETKDYLNIKQIVESVGLKLGLTGKGNDANTIYSIMATQLLYNALPPKVFKRTLIILKNTWDCKNHSFDQRIIRGMKIFMKAFHEDVKDSQLVEKLRQAYSVPEKLYSTDKDGVILAGGNKYMSYAIRILVGYNLGRRKKNGGRLNGTKLSKELSGNED